MSRLPVLRFSHQLYYRINCFAWIMSPYLIQTLLAFVIFKNVLNCTIPTLCCTINDLKHEIKHSKAREVQRTRLKCCNELEKNLTAIFYWLSFSVLVVHIAALMRTATSRNFTLTCTNRDRTVELLLLLTKIYNRIDVQEKKWLYCKSATMDRTVPSRKAVPFRWLPVVANIV